MKKVIIVFMLLSFSLCFAGYRDMRSTDDLTEEQIELFKKRGEKEAEQMQGIIEAGSVFSKVFSLRAALDKVEKKIVAAVSLYIVAPAFYVFLLFGVHSVFKGKIDVLSVGMINAVIFTALIFLQPSLAKLIDALILKFSYELYDFDNVFNIIVTLSDKVFPQKMGFWDYIGVFTDPFFYIGYLAALIFPIAILIYQFVQGILQAILYVVGPIAFAFSIIPFFKDVWQKWLGAYVTVCFWNVTFAIIMLFAETMYEQVGEFYAAQTGPFQYLGSLALLLINLGMILLLIFTPKITSAYLQIGGKEISSVGSQMQGIMTAAVSLAQYHKLAKAMKSVKRAAGVAGKGEGGANSLTPSMS